MNSRSLLLFTAIIIASTAFADMGGSGMMMSDIDPVIAPNGTVLALRSIDDHEPGSGPMHGTGMALIAVDPSGSIAWTFEADGGIHDIEVVNDLVILAVTEGTSFGWWDGIDDESSSRVVALTLAAGTLVWDLQLEEVVRSMETTTDRIYAVSGMHGQHHETVGRAVRRPGSGHGPGPGHGSGDGHDERTLFAISLDGSLLWTVPLDE